MKNIIVLLGTIGFAANAAHAQSTLTLYGLTDVGLNYTSNVNGKSQYNMSSGVLQGSRWGLKGAEDLGGGVRTIFTLENGFNITNGTLGQGGAEFGRQSYVGLSSNRYGTITIGRQYDSMVDFAGQLASADQWSGGVGAHAGDVDNMNNLNRINNGLKFTSLNYSGFSFGAAYSLGGIAGAPGRNQIYSFGAGYARGPFVLGVGYVNARDPNLSYFGVNPGSNTTGTASNMSNPIYSGYASASTQQIIATGVAYTMGSATLGLTYSNTLFKGLGNASAGPTTLQSGARVTGGTGKFNDVEVDIKYQLTPAFLVAAGYNYTSESGNGDAKYNQFMVGADYFLSKRTDFYLIGTIEHATGINSQGVAAVADLSSLSPSKSNQQAFVRLAMRHKF